jgi:non-specific serine/threonine protein kinase
MTGQRIAHYEILGRLGSGGMGDVYRARDTRLKREVALKVLPAAISDDPMRRRRFEREAQVASSIKHPGIVTIYEFGEHEGRSFIAMELVEGDSLRELIGKGPLPIDRALDIAIQVGEGLARAHESGIVHRDIKPENVIIDRDSRARVLDFGLAMPKGQTRLTADGTTVGTTHYMSPEQSTETEVDRRTDIWSLGIVLYEMIVGAVPFQADHEPATIYSILNEPHQPLTERRTNVPVELERVVDKMLAKNRAERYPSVEDLLVDLRRLRGNSTTMGSALTHRKSKRTRTMAVVAVAAVAVVALGIWIGRRGPPVAKSIAVLPFVNMSDDPGNEYFSDGLSEELLNALARLGDLRVAARTSSWRFKGRNDDVADVGRELNVATVLEGSVRRSGERLRITVQLVNTGDGFHMWSETYDRELGDVFAIQEEIANEVVRELKVRLLQEESAQLARRPTDNLDAYEAYLRGKHEMARRTSAALQSAADHFKRAVALDPEFALAYVGLADAYRLHGHYGVASYDDFVPEIERLINKAIEIDDRLGEAYASLAVLRGIQDRWAEVAPLFERAIELAPSYATAYHWYGGSLSDSDTDPAKAGAMLRKAVELDPLSPVINLAYSEHLQQIGQLDEALGRIERALELDDSFPGAYASLANLYYREYGRIDDALGSIDRAIALDPGNIGLLYGRADYLAGAGRVDEAIAACRAAVDAHPDFAWGYKMAGDLHRKLGRLDEALSFYRRAAEIEREDFWGEFYCALTLFSMGDEEAVEAYIGRMPPIQSGIIEVVYRLCRVELGRANENLEELVALAGSDFLNDTVADVALAEGRYADAMGTYEQAFPELLRDSDVRVHSGNLDPAIRIAAARIGIGETERARWLLGKCATYLGSLPETERHYEFGRQLAEVYALQGRKREALDTLEGRVDAGLRDEWCTQMRSPMLVSIRDDPEFVAVFDEVKNDVAGMRAGLTAADRTPP